MKDDPEGVGMSPRTDYAEPQMKIQMLMLLVLIIILGACKQDNATQTEAPSKPVVALSQPKVPAEFTDPTGMITLTPGAVDLCTAVDGAIAMDVKWDAKQPSVDGIKIYLKDPTVEKENLWLAAPPQGHDKTGTWMRDGTVVRLVNANTDQELTKLIVTSVACDR